MGTLSDALGTERWLKKRNRIKQKERVTDREMKKNVDVESNAGKKEIERERWRKILLSNLLSLSFLLPLYIFILLILYLLFSFSPFLALTN